MIVKGKECFNLQVGTKVKIIDFQLYIKASELGITTKGNYFENTIKKQLNYIGIITLVNKETDTIRIDKKMWFVIEDVSSLTLEVFDE